MTNKTLAAVSLDLDNQWSYMKTHGDEEWKNYPSYYNIFVPYVLEILRELDIRITFFIVGQDAVVEKNKLFLKQIVEEGHDIGNHSFQHEVWIDQYTKEQLEKEFEVAEKAIFEATGKETKGFRGPGFAWNNEILKVLNDRDYLYDTSTLPTFIGPFARIYYFWKSDFSKEERKKRKSLFGPFSLGFRRLKPYFFKLDNGKQILEIPITTVPFIRLPFHMSYLLYINSFSPFLMKLYLYFAIYICKLTRTPICYLLHPLDIIGGDRIKDLAFFPGMNIESHKKIEVFKNVMKILKKHYTLVDMDTQARNIINTKTIKPQN